MCTRPTYTYIIIILYNILYLRHAYEPICIIYQPNAFGIKWFFSFVSPFGIILIFFVVLSISSPKQVVIRVRIENRVHRIIYGPLGNISAPIHIYTAIPAFIPWYTMYMRNLLTGWVIDFNFRRYIGSLRAIGCTPRYSATTADIWNETNFFFLPYSYICIQQQKQQQSE